MDHLQSSQADPIPHLVQVYTQPVSEGPKMQSSDLIHFAHSSLHPTPEIIYQQMVTHPVNDLIPQMQQLSDCQQQILQSNVMHSASEIGSQQMHSLPLTQQQYIIPINDLVTLRNGVDYYEDFYRKEQNKDIVPKMEPDDSIVEKKKKCLPSNQEEVNAGVNKRKRHKFPEPSTWQCNIRKLKHQKGEAYIDRRGKFVPQKTIRNKKDCLTTCILKCSERVNDTERQKIFKAFYSLKWSEKKHFILSTTERNITKVAKMHGDLNQSKRKYVFKYFFVIRDLKQIVCKQFYLGTLAISQKPIYNVHSSKSELNIPKPDGRGLSEPKGHMLAEEITNKVREHILSFSTVDNKPVVHNSTKKQYLEPLLNFKKMYKLYLNECNNENVQVVKESMYRKILRNEFNLDFKKIKQEEEVLCTRCKAVVKREKNLKKKTKEVF